VLSCLVVFWTWKKRGHKRAEKVAVYYSIFSVGFFGFTLILWVVVGAIYQHSKSNGNGQDMWGWSCKTGNQRSVVYANDIDYPLLCRLQVGNPSFRTQASMLTTTGLGIGMRSH
jgi:hypothetical protein